MADYTNPGWTPPNWNRSQKKAYLQVCKELEKQWEEGKAPPAFDSFLTEERLNIFNITKGYTQENFMLEQLKKAHAENQRDVFFDLIDDHTMHIGMPLSKREGRDWWGSRGRLHSIVRNVGRKVTALSPFFDPNREGFDGSDGWFWNITGIFRDYYYVWWLFDSMEQYENYAANPHAYPTSRPWSKPYYSELANKDTTTVLAGEHKEGGKVTGKFLGWCGIAPHGKTFQRAIPKEAYEGIDFKNKIIAMGVARRRIFQGVFGNVDPEALLWRWDYWPKSAKEPVPQKPEDCVVEGRVVDFQKARSFPEFAELFADSKSGFESCYMLKKELTAKAAERIFNEATVGIGIKGAKVTPYAKGVTSHIAYKTGETDERGYFKAKVHSGNIELFAKAPHYIENKVIDGFDGTPHVWQVEEKDKAGSLHRYIVLKSGEERKGVVIVLMPSTKKEPTVPEKISIIPANKPQQTLSRRLSKVLQTPFGQKDGAFTKIGVNIDSDSANELSFILSKVSGKTDDIKVQCFVVCCGAGEADNAPIDFGQFISLEKEPFTPGSTITFGANNKFSEEFPLAYSGHGTSGGFGPVKMTYYGGFTLEKGPQPLVGLHLRIQNKEHVPPLDEDSGHYRFFCLVLRPNATLTMDEYQKVLSGADVPELEEKLYDYNFIPFTISRDGVEDPATVEKVDEDIDTLEKDEEKIEKDTAKEGKHDLKWMSRKDFDDIIRFLNDLKQLTLDLTPKRFENFKDNLKNDKASARQGLWLTSCLAVNYAETMDSKHKSANEKLVQEALPTKLGVNVSNVRQWLSGKNHITSDQLNNLLRELVKEAKKYGKGMKLTLTVPD